MDCDRAMLLIARRRERTLTGKEIARLGNHVDTCEGCTVLSAEEDVNDWVWIARVPEDALDDPDLLTLPTVDPALFDVERTIASGGMGRILKARDRRLGRDIAIKEALDDGLLDRFEREALVTARLQHPAIVPIYEAGRWMGGSAFYTMRLVAGETLARSIKVRKTVGERLALLPNVITVTEALAYAHASGVIHRDLKPSNVLLGDFGETVVIDWGLAKVLGDPDDAGELVPDGVTSSPALTVAGAVLGTPCFLAPEQAAGEAVDARADVYALGAILYTLLAGAPPFLDRFPDATASELVGRAVDDAPTPIAELAPGAPTDLRVICERAMARDPDARFPSAVEMAEELRTFEAGQLIASKDYTLSELLMRWLRRHRILVTVIGVAALAIATIGAIAVRGIAVSRDEARKAGDEARGALALAESRANELVLRQAHAALSVDPTRALAWLKQYPEDGDRIRGAALLAAEARSRGVHAHAFDIPGEEVARLAFTGDGHQLFASATLGIAAQVWDVGTGEPTVLPSLRNEDIFADADTGELFGPADECTSLRFQRAGGAARSVAIADEPSSRCHIAAAGGRVAIGRRGGRIHLWDAGESRSFSPEGAPLAFLEEGSLLLGFGRRFETLDIWRVPGGERVARMATPEDLVSTDPVDVGDVSTAARAVAIRADDRVVVWRYGAQTRAALEFAALVADVAFASSGKLIAVGLESGWVEVFDVESAKRRCRWRADASGVTRLLFVNDAAETLVVGTTRGDVLIGSSCGSIGRRLRGHTDAITHLAATSSGLVASASADRSIRIHDREVLSDDVQIETTPTAAPCETADNVYVQGGHPWFHCIFDGAPDRLISTRPGERSVIVGTSWSISGDGQAIAAFKDGVMEVNGPDAARLLPGPFSSLARLSHDGRTLFHGTGTAVEVWDVESGGRLQTRRHAVEMAVASPDGVALAVDGVGGIGVVDALGDSRTSARLDGNHRVQWSADSRLAGFQIGEKTILVFDRERREWNKLVAERGFSGFALSSDGALAVAASGDGREVVLWDLDSGARHEVPVSMRTGAATISFSDDARVVTFYGVPRSVTVRLPAFSPGAIDRSTAAVISPHGDARTRP